MVNLELLKQLTQELAEEIKLGKNGNTFNSICSIFDNLESYVAIVNSDCKLIYLNPSAIRNYKIRTNMDIKIGDNCLKLLQDNKEFCLDCLSQRCKNQRKVLSEIMTSPNTGIKYWRTCIPLIYNGTSGVIEILERHHG